MTAAWVWAVAASLVAGVASAALGGGVLLLPGARRQRLVPVLVGYAAGALLAVALLDAFPEAVALAGDARAVCETGLVAVLGFFALEQLVSWHYCRRGACARHDVAAPLVIAGDAVHNVIDGVAIAAAFAASTRVGVAVSLAIAAHEIPQEVGNVAVLLRAGFRPRRALLTNLVVNATAVVGAVAGGLGLAHQRAWVPHALAVSGASFLYLAMADLMPDLHGPDGRPRAGAVLAVMLGAVVTLAAHRALALG